MKKVLIIGSGLSGPSIDGAIKSGRLLCEKLNGMIV
jgi:hypothetical protein